MPVSSEFVALCRAQIRVLTQAFGASISIVYLTQDLGDSSQPQLVAIAAHPESLIEPDRFQQSVLLPANSDSQPSFPNLIAELDTDSLTPELTPQMSASVSEFADNRPLESIGDATEQAFSPHQSALVEQRQIVLPLIYEDGVLGLLVTRRDDRAWEDWEHDQIEEIAKTLALACVMDQRYLWREREQEQERVLHLQQHDLMDNLLHQFRNSLTALQTFGKLILRRLVPGDRSYELASSMTRETDRLRELAQQMELALDASLAGHPRSLPAATRPINEKEQLGDATLEPHSESQPIPMPPTIGLLPGSQLSFDRCLVETILEPLLASAQAIAPDKQLTIHTDVPEDLPPVWANCTALREALNNLIENALKYTPAGGQIWVVVDVPEDSPNLEIAISDTGVGIPPEDLPRIFERHFRGVQAQGDIPGSGLGLSITRSLIEQMHGKIQVFSPALTAKQQTPGLPALLTPGGTTFVLQLPIALESEEPIED